MGSAALTLSIALSSAVAGCSCADVNCSGDPGVQVRVDGLDDAVAIELCFNGDCSTAAIRPANPSGAGLRSATLSFTEAGVAPGERFALRIRVTDASGEVIAEHTDRRRHQPNQHCSCAGIGYRWNGSKLVDW